jgi:hypothetical protein
VIGGVANRYRQEGQEGRMGLRQNYNRKSAGWAVAAAYSGFPLGQIESVNHVLFLPNGLKFRPQPAVGLAK